jgi:hypothetical protein
MDTTGRGERTEVQTHVSLSHWLRSALFHAYLRRFVLLWIAGKIANAGTAHLIGIPPLAFRPASEIVTLAFELGVVVIFIKRSNEDILLGNLGLSLPAAVAPLAIVHFILSAALALFAA